MSKTKNNLDKEFKYFLDHQSELVNRYNGRYVVIVGQKVVGDYDTETEAYYSSIKKYELGSFIILKCSPGEESYSQHFHSRVTFK